MPPYLTSQATWRCPLRIALSPQHSLVGVFPTTVSAMEQDNTPTPVAPTADAAVESPVTEELLVEEISIDGMCGVY